MLHSYSIYIFSGTPLHFFNYSLSSLLFYLRSGDRPRKEWKKIMGRSIQDMNSLGEQHIKGVLEEAAGERKGT